jgi:hypothetical protein
MGAPPLEDGDRSALDFRDCTREVDMGAPPLEDGDAAYESRFVEFARGRYGCSVPRRRRRGREGVMTTVDMVDMGAPPLEAGDT